MGPPAPATAIATAQTNGDDPFFVFVVMFVGGLVGIYWGWTRYRRYTLVRDTPTAKVRSMPVGRVELEGRARVADAPLQAPFTDEDCLYAAWRVEEYRYDPDDGDHDWVTIASGTRTTPFYLEDDTGRVLIQGDHGAATFELSDACERTIRVGGSERPPPVIAEFIGDDRDDWDLSAFLEDPAGAFADVIDADGTIGHTSNRRRYVQRILPVDEPIYVFGGARPVPAEAVPDRDPGANEDLLAIGPDGATGLFLLSDRREAVLESQYKWTAPMAIVGGLALSTVGLYFILDWYVLA